MSIKCATKSQRHRQNVVESTKKSRTREISPTPWQRNWFKTASCVQRTIAMSFIASSSSAFLSYVNKTDSPHLGLSGGGRRGRCVLRAALSRVRHCKEDKRISVRGRPFKCFTTLDMRVHRGVLWRSKCIKFIFGRPATLWGAPHTGLWPRARRGGRTNVCPSRHRPSRRHCLAYTYSVIYLRNRRWGGSVCFADVFLFFLFFSVRQKIWDNRSREQLNGFSWNFYQTIAGYM